MSVLMRKRPIPPVPRVFGINCNARAEAAVICEQAGNFGGHGKVEDSDAEVGFQALAQVPDGPVAEAQAVSLRGGDIACQLLHGCARRFIEGWIAAVLPDTQQPFQLDVVLGALLKFIGALLEVAMLSKNLPLRGTKLRHEAFGDFPAPDKFRDVAPVKAREANKLLGKDPPLAFFDGDNGGASHPHFVRRLVLSQSGGLASIL